MMLCDDMSNILMTSGNGQSHRSMDGLISSGNGQSLCAMDGLPGVGPRTRDNSESTPDPLAMMPSSKDRSKQTPTPGSQSNRLQYHAEHIQQLRNDEQTTNFGLRDGASLRNSAPDKFSSGSSIIESVTHASSSETSTEVRNPKRMAQAANLQSYGVKKRMRLDRSPLLTDSCQTTQPQMSIQEHWKKDARIKHPREMPQNSSEMPGSDILRCSKDELSQHLSRLDSAILHNEMARAKLRNTLEQLEESIAKSSRDHGDGDDGNEVSEQQLNCLDQILIENRRKAEISHSFLNETKSIGQPALYQQPSDTAVYHENKHKFMTFKKKLIVFLKSRNKKQQAQTERISKRYNKVQEEWKKKMETIEGSDGLRLKKLREYFDKIFPDMRKQEEEKIQRYCSSVLKLPQKHDSTASKVDMADEVMQKLRSLAAIPPPLLDSKSRKLCFHNENGLVEDASALNRSSILKCSFWTEHEREKFTEKFVRHPKKFGAIALCLENKTVQDCVQFYYLTKKDVGYKKLRPRCFRKPKIRGTVNNAKEEKIENRNSTNSSSCELFRSLDSRPAAVEEKNAVETECNRESASVTSCSDSKRVEQEANERPSSAPACPIPNETSSVKSNPASVDEDKSETKDISEDVPEPQNRVTEDAECSRDKSPATEPSCVTQEQSVEKEGWSEKNRDSNKADDNNDAESVATLSADEASGNCQDDNALESDAADRLPSANEKQQTFETDSAVVAELHSPATNGIVRLQRLIPIATADDSRTPSRQDRDNISPCLNRPSSGQSDNRSDISSAIASQLLMSNPRNESREFLRSAEFTDDEHAKLMPELLPLPGGGPRAGQRTYSPSAAHCFARSAVPIAGFPPVTRSTGSPTRIRDLIHAAIEKTLQGTETKADVGKRPTACPKGLRPSDSNFNNTMTAVEATEAQDLSMRTSRRQSSGMEPIASTVGKTLPLQPAACRAPSVESAYQLRPAHSNHLPDPRTGFLPYLAIAAEYDNQRRSEKGARIDTAERDGPPVRFETMTVDDAFNPSSNAQTLRQREEPVHKGSIMQGTPISTAQQLHQVPRPPSEVLYENRRVHPSSAGLYPAGQQEWQRANYPPVAAQIPSEHFKLLRDDYLTAQKLRSMQDSFVRPEIRDHRIPQYHRFPDYPPRPGLPHQNDPYFAEHYQPPRLAPPSRNFQGADVPFQHAPQQFVRYGDGQTLADNASQATTERLVGRIDNNRNDPMAQRMGASDVQRAGFQLERERNKQKCSPLMPTPAQRTQEPRMVWSGLGEGCSAAQLIEAIICTQISRPDNDEKHGSSILKQLDEINSASFANSVFPNAPEMFRPNRGMDEPREPRTSSRSVALSSLGRENAIPNDSRTSQRGFLQRIETHDQEIHSDSDYTRKRVQLPEKDYRFGLEVPEKSVPSGVGRPSSVGRSGNASGVRRLLDPSAEKQESSQPQAKRVTTVGESFDAIIESVTQENNFQNAFNDRNQIAMRNFLGFPSTSAAPRLSSLSLPSDNSCPDRNQISDDSNRIAMRNFLGISSASTVPHLGSIPYPSDSSSPDRIQISGEDSSVRAASDVVRAQRTESVALKESSSASSQPSRGFNWKTKILREHQKQQIEIQDGGHVEKSGELENESSSRRPPPLSSSDVSSHSNDDERSWTCRPEATAISSCSTTSSGPSVLDDHQSAIAASHQMMSNLLSNKPGRQSGSGPTVPTSSTTAASNLSEPQSSKPATSSRDSMTVEVEPSIDQSEKHSNGPKALSPELGSDSDDLDPPGRLVIRMDSVEDLHSPPLVT